ncbi:MAG: Asp23/Gls24 family envelope stress response protein [Lachnospiraceae bacterium]|nr:Asp23/Gls24 family envelope stress response protein [Lachnospiraceae bacterium]
MKKNTVMKLSKETNSNTHMGNISINSDVIAEFAGAIAMECFGIVGMAGLNVKDGLVKLLKLDDIKRGVSVLVRNNKLVINFHIIVAYGVNVMSVSENLISTVKYRLEEFTGIEVAKVNIFVEGVRVID